MRSKASGARGGVSPPVALTAVEDRGADAAPLAWVRFQPYSATRDAWPRWMTLGTENATRGPVSMSSR